MNKRSFCVGKIFAWTLLDWSRFADGQIVLQLKDTQGILDGSVTVKASTLQRIHPALLPVQLDAEYLFPITLRTVVLQVQANLNQNLGEVPKPVGSDFDTPIAQIAREDDEFFKLEKLAQLPQAPIQEKAETKRLASEATLTHADRPVFPLIRNKPSLEGKKSEPTIAGGLVIGAIRLEDLEAKEARVEEVERSIRGIAQKALCRIGLERLQEIFMTEELLDAGLVAKLVAALPKVKCAFIMLGDGTQ
jgi:hypothetical protein